MVVLPHKDMFRPASLTVIESQKTEVTKGATTNQAPVTNQKPPTQGANTGANMQGSSFRQEDNAFGASYLGQSAIDGTGRKKEPLVEIFHLEKSSAISAANCHSKTTEIP